MTLTTDEQNNIVSVHIAISHTPPPKKKKKSLPDISKLSSLYLIPCQRKSFSLKCDSDQKAEWKWGKSSKE